jgi:hypothetical protein
MFAGINYELVAVQLGDEIKWDVSVATIDRNAKAILKVQKRNFPQAAITSVRAQAVYDWVMTLALSSLSENEKKARLSILISLILPPTTIRRDELLALVGHSADKTLGPVPEFDALTREASLAELLCNRWIEAQRCVQNKAFLSAIIMMGSILEGVLLGVVRNNPAAANKAPSSPKSDGKPKTFGDWKLSELIAVSHDCRWIQADVKDFSDALREYRNMVHPWYQLSKGFEPDADTCTICVNVLFAAFNDLQDSQRHDQSSTG